MQEWLAIDERLAEPSQLNHLGQGFGSEITDLSAVFCDLQPNPARMPKPLNPKLSGSVNH